LRSSGIAHTTRQSATDHSVAVIKEVLDLFLLYSSTVHNLPQKLAYTAILIDMTDPVC